MYCDASSMYTNIDTNHALVILEEFYCTSPLAHGVNSSACLDAIHIIMRHNIFHFRDTIWVQQNGSTMGTSTALAYVQLYFIVHVLNFVQQFPQLQFYVRYLDDIFIIWHPNHDSMQNSTNWSSFQESANSFGNLRWNFEKCTKPATLLDLEIHLDLNGQIHTDIYEKELNLYLYLPPHSSHSPRVL